VPDALEYPLFSGVSITGTSVVVDDVINDPERITRDVAALTMQRFYMDRIFTSGGGLTGGALLFERPNPLATDLYGEREPKEVQPGQVFPLQTFTRGVPMMAKPKKIGNKWFMVKEAVKRNDTGLLRRRITQTVNTLRRRIEQLGLAELAAVVTAESRFRTGTSWSTYAGLAPNVRTGTTGPVSDIFATIAAVDLEERGHALDSMLMHPNQAVSVMQAYPGMTLQQVFSAASSSEFGGGIQNIYVTPRHAAGVATLFESGQVGEWRNEFPLEQETEWEGPASGGRQRWWYQWSISPLFAVTDQFAVIELRGIA
jgi:hypothetical protein